MSQIITVSELNKYVSEILSEDDFLQFVIIKGEISGLKKYPSGHFYFSIKDSTAIIQCVMFSGYAMQLNKIPEDGDKIIAAGRVELYEIYGKYQFQVQNIHSVGLGELESQRELLKNKLQELGYLGRKRFLPKMPHQISVVTSIAGAAVEDIIQTFSRRFPLAILNICHAQVQGVEAEKSIVNAIKKADLCGEIVILARGGGSKEDLSAYDSEAVAMAIWNCSVPVISAIGHETDFSISDLVSDLRASTPTAAAEMCAPSIIELMAEIRNFELMLNLNSPLALMEKSDIKLQNIIVGFEKIITEKINFYCHKLDLILNDITNCINEKIGNAELDIIQNIKKINYLYYIIINNLEIEVKNSILKLETISPLKILERGYSIASSNQEIITNCINLKQGEEFILQLANGKVLAEVKEVLG